MLTPTDLDALEAMHQKATGIACFTYVISGDAGEKAAYVQSVVNALPALLAMAREALELKAELAALECAREIQAMRDKP